MMKGLNTGLLACLLSISILYDSPEALFVLPLFLGIRKSLQGFGALSCHGNSED